MKGWPNTVSMEKSPKKNRLSDIKMPCRPLTTGDATDGGPQLLYSEIHLGLS